MRRIILFELIEIILLFILIVVPLRLYLFTPFFVRGESMEPNFHNWDYIIIDKLTYVFRQPQRGEIVVFHPPFDKKVYYIKRIVGLPNERIFIEENRIKIFNKENPNGFILKEDYLENHYTSGRVDVKLGPNEYFVLGDNREVSYDSRKWGPVKREKIVGKVLFRISIVELAKAFTK